MARFTVYHFVSKRCFRYASFDSRIAARKYAVKRLRRFGGKAEISVDWVLTFFNEILLDLFPKLGYDVFISLERKEKKLNTIYDIRKVYNEIDDNTIDFDTNDIFAALATFGRIRVRIAEDLDYHWLREQLNYEASELGCGLRVNSLYGDHDIEAFDIYLRKFAWRITFKDERRS